MLNLLFALNLTFSPLSAPVPVAQEEDIEVESPDPAQVKAAVESLEQAFKKGKSPERIQALEEHGEVEDPEVVKLVTKGLKDKDPMVQVAAVEALRWQKGPNALEALQAALKKDKSIKKVDALHEAVIKAIGQHANPKSIDVLMDKALSSNPREVTIARIYALGHIRDKESVESLIGLMQKTGRNSKTKGVNQPLMKQFAVSLEVLTGEGFGEKENEWASWWRENKKSFEVSEAPAVPGPKVARFWKKYWSKDSAANQSEETKGKKKRREREEDSR